MMLSPFLHKKTGRRVVIKHFKILKAVLQRLLAMAADRKTDIFNKTAS